jgi:hypothetical protein
MQLEVYPVDRALVERRAHLVSVYAPDVLGSAALQESPAEEAGLSARCEITSVPNSSSSGCAASLRVKLMLRDATRFMEDAERLRGDLLNESHSAYLLDLLALEILLKSCVVLETAKLERGHDYGHIFLKLCADRRNALIQSAAARMGPSADYSDTYRLLALYGANFIRMRYPYEPYGGISEAEYLRLGSEWIERGALVEDAIFDFRPIELHGLLYALSKFAGEKLAG